MKKSRGKEVNYDNLVYLNMLDYRIHEPVGLPPILGAL